MLEILFLFWFGKKLAAMAQEKGRSGAWAALGVALWIGGELFGFVLGLLLELDMGIYLTALGCAIAGAVVAFGIVNALPPTELAPDRDDPYAVT
jgi:hypothetical protein